MLWNWRSESSVASFFDVIYVCQYDEWGRRAPDWPGDSHLHHSCHGITKSLSLCSMRFVQAQVSRILSFMSRKLRTQSSVVVPFSHLKTHLKLFLLIICAENCEYHVDKNRTVVSDLNSWIRHGTKDSIPYFCSGRPFLVHTGCTNAFQCFCVVPYLSTIVTNVQWAQNDISLKG